MPFPWYSFDTTNPILAAGRAELAIPRLLRDGSPDWNRSTFYASITRRAKMNSRHLEFMGQPLEDHIRALTKAAGEDFDVLRESRCLRFRYNAHIFKEQFSHRPTPKFSRKKLVRIPGTLEGSPTPVNEHVRMICAVNTSRCDNTGLTQIGFDDRLVSYTFINRWNRKKVRDFIQSGVPHTRTGLKLKCEADLNPRVFSNRPKLKKK